MVDSRERKSIREKKVIKSNDYCENECELTPDGIKYKSPLIDNYSLANFIVSDFLMELS